MIAELEVLPSYYGGFVFTWNMQLSAGTGDTWYFVVQESPTGVTDDGSWTDISPLLISQFAFQEPRRKSSGKDPLFFRVAGSTSPSGTPTYSPIIDAFGELGRREMNIAREILRRKQLAFADMEGVSIQIWRKMHVGTPCPRCLDPITGMVRDPQCPVCHGTGKIDGFFGPYSGCAKFSMAQVHKKYAGSATGVDDDRMFSVELLGFPRIVRDDIITECKSDRRYVVGSVSNEVEVRRIPIMQLANVYELPRNYVVYALGEELVV